MKRDRRIREESECVRGERRSRDEPGSGCTGGVERGGPDPRSGPLHYQSTEFTGNIATQFGNSILGDFPEVLDGQVAEALPPPSRRRDPAPRLEQTLRWERDFEPVTLALVREAIEHRPDGDGRVEALDTPVGFVVGTDLRADHAHPEHDGRVVDDRLRAQHGHPDHDRFTTGCAHGLESHGALFDERGATEEGRQVGSGGVIGQEQGCRHRF